jgi:carbonic anhydrase
MQRLIEGYSRFRSKVFPEHSKLFARLAEGQKPQALFIACSDSRVMPEMVMQCEPGDLFPCRNAGNLVPPPTETTSGVAATIEYAIRVLKIPDVAGSVRRRRSATAVLHNLKVAGCSSACQNKRTIAGIHYA